MKGRWHVVVSTLTAEIWTHNGLCPIATGMTEPEAHALVDSHNELIQALAGFVGLWQLVRGRDDMPAKLRAQVEANHRTHEAWRVLGENPA